MQRFFSAMNVRIAMSLLTAAGLIFACVDHPSAPQVSRPGGPRVPGVDGQGRRHLSIDDEFVAIATAESTFSGAILDSMQRPVVLLTDISRLGAARAAGADEFFLKRRFSVEGIRAVSARYGFGTLKRWYDCAGPLVFSLPGARTTDIDEAHNRLHYRVATATAKGSIEAFASQCGIPSDALSVDVLQPFVQPEGLDARAGAQDRGPLRDQGDVETTVRDRVRPLRGGTEIATGKNVEGSIEICNIGLIGRYLDSLAFLTASHCSEDWIPHSGVDTTSFWQTTRNVAGDSLGRETIDPGYFSGGACYAGALCRFTDVNLSFLHTTATAKPGLIARTLSPSSNPLSAGSLTLDRLHPGLFVTAIDTFAPPYATVVCKTGRTTGTTCGPSRSTSEHVKLLTYGGVNYWVLYQTDFHAWSLSRDSGSPVYRWNGSDSTVMFEGIFIGSPDCHGCDTPDSTAYFSTWDWITDEIFNYTNIMSVVADTPYSVGPAGVYIAGDTGIGVPDTYEWYAMAYGGTGSYTYQWKSQDSGSSTWDSHGTSSSQALPIYSYTPKFTLRVIASSGGTADTADLFVNVSPLTGIDISGTSDVHEGIVCHWTATPTGGNAPYIYDWMTGSVVDTTLDASDTYGLYVLEYFWVRVTVTAQNGSQDSAKQEVIVEEGAPGC